MITLQLIFGPYNVVYIINDWAEAFKFLSGLKLDAVSSFRVTYSLVL